jgi:hypothetical protein
VNPRIRTAFVVGLLFVITFVASIPAAVAPYTPVLAHTDYILGAGADNRIALGAFLEMILIVANIGTAVVLFPILRRQNEALSRLRHCTCHGKRFHRRRPPEPACDRDVAAEPRWDGGHGRGLARHSWQVARCGPRLDVPARARLGRRRRERVAARLPDVPVRPRAAGHGDAGADRGPAGSSSRGPQWFDVIESGSSAQVIATIPGFFWELSPGIYLMVKRFKPSPITDGLPAATTV